MVKAQRFEVAPTRMDFNLEPGQNGQMMLNIKNHMDMKKSYSLVLSDWEVNEDGTVTYLPAGTSEKSCSDWITLNPPFFELQPNESRKIAVIMRVPDDPAAQSSRWSMLFVQEAKEQNETMSADKSTKAGVTINPSVGVYVFQTPASYNNVAATISNFRDVEKGSTVAVDVKNIGDVLIKGKVYLIISDLQTAEETQLDPREFTILPGVSKTLELSLPENMAPGLYTLTAVLDYSPDKDLEGVIMDYEIE
jgi:P pilus assembly chaperone PapD